MTPLSLHSLHIVLLISNCEQGALLYLFIYVSLMWFTSQKRVYTPSVHSFHFTEVSSYTSFAFGGDIHGRDVNHPVQEFGERCRALAGGLFCHNVTDCKDARVGILVSISEGQEFGCYMILLRITKDVGRLILKGIGVGQSILLVGEGS